MTPEPADTSVGVGIRVSDKLGLEVPEKRARGGCSVWFTSDLYSTSKNRWGRNTEAKRKKKKKRIKVLAHMKKGIGEGNGTPLQYSCLENPMDGGAW